MRRATWAVLLAGLAGAGLARAQDDKAYDLRGPAPKRGQAVVGTTVFKIKNADFKLKAGGTELDGKMTMTSTDEEEVTALAVDGRQVTKARTRVLKEQVETVTDLGGDDAPDTKPGDLDGEVIVSERTGPGKWKHTLVDTKPSDKQKKELDKRVGPENDDDLYPAGEVKVGHAWEVDAAALQKVFGGSVQDLKGKLKAKFVRVEEVGGEPCAVVEMAGSVKGVAKEDEGDLAVEMDLTSTTWRSLKTGVDVRERAKGRVKMAGTVEMDGQKAEIVMEGPFTIEGTARPKGPKAE
ncbi:MAG: hypothetical protein K2X82_28765 [Gemmataceae bacterium]|nr:hypothetical protein [Gemmataceae bacterium]